MEDVARVMATQPEHAHEVETRLDTIIRRLEVNHTVGMIGGKTPLALKAIHLPHLRFIEQMVKKINKLFTQPEQVVLYGF